MQVERKITDHFKKKNGMGDGRKYSTKMKTDKGKRVPKLKKRKRLIIRNLSFKVDEAELKNIFLKFGNLTDVKIPLKEDGKKRGFAFVEFEDTKALIQAIKLMNYKEIHGRKVAIDFAVDKTTYQLKVQSLREEGKDVPIKREIKVEPGVPEMKTEVKSESESSDDEEAESSDGEEADDEEVEDEKRLNDFLKEFDSGADVLTKPQVEEDEEVSSSEDSFGDESEAEEEESGHNSKKIKQEFEETTKFPTKRPKHETQDISEGKTVFLRNVAFVTAEETLKEAMEEYGECAYCLLCMDQITDHPKGTGFVKFKEKSSADKLVQESDVDPGVVVDGRRLQCSYAISRQDIAHLGDGSKKPKDKRNLNLLRVSLIMPDSKESEGISHSDRVKRTQLEAVKKQKLRNVNFFVSDRRLVIHNLPRNCTDAELRKIFKTASGSGAHITEARVMKEFKKLDHQGNAFTKGFGFVSFSKHEDALRTLTQLNNNPTIFTPQKRPIVEFSVENKVALLSKERRKEKIQMRNKRRTDEKRERQVGDETKKASVETTTKGKKRKNKKNVNTPNKKMKAEPQHNNESENKLNSPKSKRKKKKSKLGHPKKEKKQVINKSQQDNLSNLITKYKGKLMNKIT